MRVLHEFGQYIAVEHNGIERLRYHYQLENEPTPSAPKPFIHPIRTPNGLELTAHSPLDHFWHRGLWFTIKYIDGVNYWEENQEIVGIQRTVLPPVITPLFLGSPLSGTRDAVEWNCGVVWSDTRDGATKVRLQEGRRIVCYVRDDGTLILDWHSHLQAQEAVTLDRTVFTTWGGYGGLFVRLTQALQKQQIVLGAEDGSVTTTSAPTGEIYRWGGIEGLLDMHTDQEKQEAAVVFLPSPRNTRFPEPFYGNAKPFYNFFGPAPLFHEPLPLAEGETWSYSVRVLILPQRIDPSVVEGYYQGWADEEFAR